MKHFFTISNQFPLQVNLAGRTLDVNKKKRANLLQEAENCSRDRLLYVKSVTQSFD